MSNHLHHKIKEQRVVILFTLYITNGAVAFANSIIYLEAGFSDWKDILIWDGELVDEALMKNTSVLYDNEMREGMVAGG